LKLSGTETVLDFGCGTGRDAERLLDAVPNGRVVAVDGSPEMLARLRKRLIGRLNSIDILEVDLRDRLPLRSVDAVMSVATLHWLPDHATVFSNIAAILRYGWTVRGRGRRGGQYRVDPDGRLASRLLVQQRDPINRARRNFAGIDDTVRNLSKAGFVDIHVELVADPMPVPENLFEAYLAAIILVPELHEIQASDRSTFVRAVAQEVGEPIVDWVRIRLTATRS